MIGSLIDYRRARAAIGQARDPQALADELRRLAGADGRLRGVNGAVLAATVLALALVAGAAVWLRWTEALLLTAAVAAVLLPLQLHAWRLRRAIVTLALERAAWLDEGLARTSCDGPATWRELRRTFTDFHRGDKWQTIDELAEGQVRLGDQPVVLRCYRFAYVQADGRAAAPPGKPAAGSGREAVHHRHGLIVELKSPLGLGVSAVRRPDFPHRCSSGSDEFDRQYKLAVQDEAAAAQVLTPRVLGLMAALGGHLTGLDIELRATGLCIAFDAADWLRPAPTPVQHSDRVDDILAQMARRDGLPELRRLLTLVHALAPLLAALPPAKAAAPTRFTASTPAAF